MLFQRMGRYQQALGFYLSLRDSAESMMVSDRAQMLANLATEPIFFPAYDPPMTPACQVGGPQCARWLFHGANALAPPGFSTFPGLQRELEIH